MRILVLSQYFWPEGFIINDVVRILDAQGHELMVATGKPNYPDGKILNGYSPFSIQRERYLNRIEVLRVPLFPRGRGGAVSLVLNYCSFVLSGLLFLPWLLRKYSFDAILVFAPSPITQVIPAIPLKWLCKAKLAVWVQDLWPESLSATGFLKNSYLLRAVGLMVRFIYSQCDALLVQSPAFFDPVSKYVSRDRIHYYPNSIDVQSYKSGSRIPREVEELLDNYFCVVFAGNLGLAQSLDTLVQAALKLRDDPRIRLVLVGSGSRLEWLKLQKQSLGLENLVLLGRFPAEVMPQIFERASVLLASLEADPVFAKTIPSKIQAYLAAGRPIVASMNGEGARVVRESCAGLTSSAGAVMPLVANIRKLKSLSSEELEAMGRAGKAYFDSHFEMFSQVRSLVDLLQRL